MNSVSDWSFTTYPEATSSSDLASDAAAAGASEGVGFLALVQTAGRGRRGASWRSAQGGMYFSLLLRPHITAHYWYAFSFIAALAIRDALHDVLPTTPLTLKWPNDVLAGAGDDRGKICGILLEASGDHLIVGTGVNIASVPTPEGAKQPAVAVDDFKDGAVTPQALAAAYQQNFARRYMAFTHSVMSGAGAVDPGAAFAPVRDEWLVHTAHQNARLSVHHGGRVITGQFVTLGTDGTLHILDDAGDDHHITTGDVELIGMI